MNNYFMLISTLKIKLLYTLAFFFSFILQFSNLQAQPVQAWKFATGSAVHSSAVISGNNVYFGSGDQNIYALNKASGKLNWKFKTNGEVHSTPTLHQNQLLFTSTDGNIYAINKDNGSLIWTFKTKGEQKYDAWDYYLSSPTVYKNTVYVGSGDSNVYAINAETGKLTWSYQTKGIVHATPVLKDDVLYVGSYDGTFYALNSTTGALIWSFKTVGDTHFPKGEIQKAAMIHENTVFFGSRDYNIYALDVKTGTGKWNMKEKGSWILATPFLYNGNLFFGTSDTFRFYAMTSEFGDLKWTLPLNMRVYGTAALLGNHIVFGCFNGKLYFVDPETGKVQSTFQTEESKKRYSTIYNQKDEFREELKTRDYAVVEKEILALGSILSSPLVENNTVYFGDTNGFFYAVNAGGIVK